MKVSANSIKGLIVVVVMATIFFSMAPALVHTFGLGVGDFLTELTNTTVYGTGPGAIATILNNNWGYFLIVGALVLVIGLATGIFKGRR